MDNEIIFCKRIMDAYGYGTTEATWGAYRLEIRRNACTCTVARWDAGARSRYDDGAGLVEVEVNPYAAIMPDFVDAMPELAAAQRLLNRYEATRGASYGE